MCGITGVIDFNKQSSNEVLLAMTNSLAHRGPDGIGVDLQSENEFQIGFGHRRLSIIDLTENAKQPMQFNQFSITFNGEIYNYKEIKLELEKLNHSFSTNSDTEMIIHAYSEWREACLEKFIGMFAFCGNNKCTYNIGYIGKVPCLVAVTNYCIRLISKLLC